MQNQEILVRKSKKGDNLDSLNAFYEGREMVLDIFKSGIFLSKLTGDTDNSGISACVTEVSPFKSQNIKS